MSGDERSRASKRARASAIWLACLVLITGAASTAEDEIESGRSGPYFGVNLGAAIPNFSFEYFATPPPFNSKTTEETSIEVMARAGWRLLPYLAIEGQYEWVREWELKTKDTTCVKADADIFTGNIRVFAPFDAVHPYLVGGAGAGRYKSRVIQKKFDTFSTGANNCAVTQNVGLTEDEWELAIRLGGGIDVYITRNVVFNLEASTIYSDDEQLGESFPFVSVSGGLGYRF
jgi:opacity protein-like surface antigen